MFTLEKGARRGPPTTKMDTRPKFPTLTPDYLDIYIGNGSAAVTSNGSYDLPDLHALANASEGGNPEGVSASATFSEDELAFDPSSPGVAGISFMTFNFNVSGTLTGYATAYLTLNFGSYNSSYALTSGLNTLSFQVPASGLTPSGGDELDGTYSEILSTSVSNGGNPGTNAADFTDTVHLTSVDVTDSKGNPVAGTFTDGDQVSFVANTTLTPTPEPGTIPLLAASALWLGYFIKTRFHMRVVT